jgi:RNA polymerase sigma factor (sigma-70 family)
VCESRLKPVRFCGCWLLCIELIKQTDEQLLAVYANQDSELAFSELVERHIDLVYSAALRMVRDPHMAQDVAQATFIALAQNARKLSGRAVLSGWLHRTAQNVAANTVRSEVRRRAREEKAAALNEPNATGSENLWDQIAPHLDLALAALNEADRDALLLRYFERKSAREISALLGTTEQAAQKRVNRATERLRTFFAARGVTAGATGIMAAIGTNAVLAAPTALAGTISITAVATTLAAGTTATATKVLAMTTLQKTIIGATLAAAISTGVYQSHQSSRLREQVQSLQQQRAPLADQLEQAERERDAALKQVARLSSRQTPRLPPPALRTSSPPPEEASATSLYSRITNYQATLKPSQVESYLSRNGRSAASLLAAYRTTRDTNLLAEAMQKYPGDAQVAFEAMFKADATSDARRQWLEAFKTNAPENALPNYLSALDHFKAGQADQAVQELIAGAAKGQFSDYTQNRMQDDEEAYLAAGYSAAEAKTIPGAQLLLPQLAPMKDLSRYIVDLANSYQQAGDQNSAEAALQMLAGLGQRYANGVAGETTISRLVGMAVETRALKELDPNTSNGSPGQTVKDRLDALMEQREQIKQLAGQTDALMPLMTPEDWISYKDRWKLFGEESASKWLIAKYGQK